MLTSAHIKHFRSCKDVKLDNLGHMVALVGRNGAGKTTILRALEWVAETALSNNASDRLDTADHLNVMAELQAELVLHIGDRSYRYKIDRVNGEDSPVGRPLRAIDTESLSILQAGDNVWTSLFERTESRVVVDNIELKIGPSTAAIPALSALLATGSALRPHLHAIADAFQRIHYYPGHFVSSQTTGNDPEPIGPIAEDVYERWVSAHSQRPKHAPLLFRLIHAHEERRAVFSEIKQLMGSVGLDLLRDIRVVKLGDFESEPSRYPRYRYFDVRFSPTHSTVELSLDELSGGTRHALYILIGLLYDDNSTLLIEQPEDGIHPGLLTKLIDLLRVNADPAQIILTSHSPVVLSSLQASDIRLVDIQDDSTTVRALSPAEIQRAQEYMQRDGTLAEFLELIQE